MSLKRQQEFGSCWLASARARASVAPLPLPRFGLCWGQHSLCPLRAHPTSKILPGGSRTRLTLSAGLGFGPTAPGLAQAEDLGHEGLWIPKPQKWGRREQTAGRGIPEVLDARDGGGSRGREEPMHQPRAAPASQPRQIPLPAPGCPHGRAPTATSTPVGFLHTLPRNWSHFHLLFPSLLLIRT